MSCSIVSQFRRRFGRLVLDIFSVEIFGVTGQRHSIHVEQSRSKTSDPRGLLGELTSVQFAQVARDLTHTARQNGLVPPTFRSPPRTAGLRRSINRRSDGTATVSVALRGRPAMAVIADMIDGIQAANAPAHRQAAGKYHLNKELYDCLWSAASAFLEFSSEKAGTQRAVGQLAA